MIFARYIGTDKRFSKGKVYPAMPEVQSSDTVSFRSIEVRDDSGEMVKVVPHVEMVPQEDGRHIWSDDWDFEFLEEVYAVVAKPFDDLKRGQVVVLDDADPFDGEKSDGGTWSRLVYSVKGIGFRSSDLLVILDRTNVFPGMVIQDEATGNWVRIRIVDECLWVVMEDNTGRRSPEGFRFAVDRDGDIQVEPFVECVDDTGQVGLTKGKSYRILRVEYQQDDGRRTYVVVNDIGSEVGYLASRFPM